MNFQAPLLQNLHYRTHKPTIKRSQQLQRTSAQSVPWR